MDLSRAKNFLDQVEVAKQKCIQISYELEEIKMRSDNLVAKYGLNIGGGSNNPDISNQIAALEEEQRILEEAKEKWLKKKDEVKSFICKLDIPADKECLRTLLFLKYIALVDFTEIAYKLGYSYNYVVRKLHTKSLEIVEKKLKLYTKKSKRVNDVQ